MKWDEKKSMQTLSCFIEKKKTTWLTQWQGAHWRKHVGITMPVWWVHLHTSVGLWGSINCFIDHFVIIQRTFCKANTWQKKVHSLTKCLILCILLWPNIFTYNENVSQEGTFSWCINCALYTKKQWDHEEWKIFPFIKRSFYPFKSHTSSQIKTSVGSTALIEHIRGNCIRRDMCILFKYLI